MHYRPIITDDTKQEITNFDIENFPLALDKQTVSRSDIAGIPHWHYEIQISVVIKGSVIFRTPDGDFLLNHSQGIFINSGIMHEIIATSEGDGEYVCLNFDPRMLSGDNDQYIRNKYINPVLYSRKMQVFLLENEAWHKKICELVIKAGEISNRERFGNELGIKAIIYRIWEILVYYNQVLLEEKAISQSDKERLGILLEYIHENYLNPITLTDIANAGNVSRSECCRLFKRTRNVSPIAYLQNYRIRQSIKLLTCTSLSIGEIAQQTGFRTGSYFSACFKKEVGRSPLKYRSIVHNMSQEKQNLL